MLRPRAPYPSSAPTKFKQVSKQTSDYLIRAWIVVRKRTLLLLMHSTCVQLIQEQTGQRASRMRCPQDLELDEIIR
jgi:hypothetical protein